MFTIEALQQLFTQYEGQGSKDKPILEVVTDSRKTTTNGLFVPIRGDNFDAHDFIFDAVNNGAIATLWDKNIAIPQEIKQSIIFFLVDDTIEGLQVLAKYYRKKVNPHVIGITGSNGKTSTKDVLYAVLQTTYKTYATKGNLNNHIGLPLTILQMPRGTEMLIVEMGMSDFGEIETLTNIALPNDAIITNIGESHIEHLGSREGIARAKLEIKAGLAEQGHLIIDGDELLLEKEHHNDNVTTCGFLETNDYVVSQVILSGNSTRFNVNGQSYQLPLLGKHHAQNASFVIALAEKLQINHENIQAGMQGLEYSNMRFEQLNGRNGVTLINDAYNASPTSMKAAIEVVKQLSGYKDKIVVLGDVLELGEYSESLHRSIADVIDTNIQYVYLYGDATKFIHDALITKQLDMHIQHFTNKDALLEKLVKHTNKETMILFKASRGMKFEQFIEALMA